MTLVLDCDGVVWLGEEPIPGSSEAVARLRRAGERVVFLTNNSFPRMADHLAKLERLGMPTSEDDLISSPMAAASLLETGQRALVLGGPGIFEALASRGVAAFEPGGEEPNDGEPYDAVVVGFDLKFDFSRLAAATTALRDGARLIATNDDATLPVPAGQLPGAGSFVAAVATAGGKEAEIAGKPHRPTAELLIRRVGQVEWVIGDRPSTDGRLAKLIGSRFGLVLTGVTPAGHGPVDPPPDDEAADLASLARKLST